MLTCSKKRFLIIFIASIIFFTGCAAGQKNLKASGGASGRFEISQIESFHMETACAQAIDVIENNPYRSEFFQETFARLVSIGEKSTSETNADVIWDYFVIPLKQTGKVPPDLAVETWNQYFSNQFVCLPDTAPATNFCHDLAAIKSGLEREYRLKQKGFSICRQGSPDSHFLNAMYVYNTMWAACRDAE